MSTLESAGASALAADPKLHDDGPNPLLRCSSILILLISTDCIRARAPRRTAM
ncbi:MAG: hypothetical protein ACKVI4_14230 [Actinomycetales bacterium]